MITQMSTEFKPYIGVTGFTDSTEVTTALDSLPPNANRLLMVGILASWKTLREIPLNPRWQQRHPSTDQTANLFPRDSRALNLVHYATEAGQEHSLLADMVRLEESAGPYLDGFQLNIPWPEVRQIEEFVLPNNSYRLILQIGKEALDLAGGNRIGVTKMLSRYVNLVTDVLFDLSGGRGIPLDPEIAYSFLSAIADKGWDLNLGVAGGLEPDTLYLVESLVKHFPNLNIDAEGQLLNTNGNLDLDKVGLYLQRADKLFGYM